EKSDKLILNLTRLKISFVLQSIQAKACLELLRSFCKQNVHSLVVQFSKIKHVLSQPSFGGDFNNVTHSVCFRQELFLISFLKALVLHFSSEEFIVC
ncbi:hypothetical protein ACH0BY_26960, partial [Paenibacillus amylolyticus]|uniref:hypothetical protein n=1 Tax=Paenibacillus amylolyticus TaxID=1451 RepID=UPI00387A22E8